MYNQKDINNLCPHCGKIHTLQPSMKMPIELQTLTEKKVFIMTALQKRRNSIDAFEEGLRQIGKMKFLIRSHNKCPK